MTDFNIMAAALDLPEPPEDRLNAKALDMWRTLHAAVNILRSRDIARRAAEVMLVLCMEDLLEHIDNPAQPACPPAKSPAG